MSAHTEGSNTGMYRCKLGAFELIALHDGVLVRDAMPQFVRNASAEAVGAASRAAGMPADKITITFTALAVRAGERLVLIDTGLGAGGPPGTGKLLDNLRAAGFGPEQVTDVIISHCHGDHIGGLRAADGAKTYPRATIHMPAPEWAYWSDARNKDSAPEMAKGNFDAVAGVFAGLEGELKQFAWGDEILPGFTAVDAHGHTPGMTAIDIASDGERAMFVADITNNPLLFARHPTWQVAFDADPEVATETRLRLLGQAADEARLLFFFHAPFPGLAYVVRNGEGFEYLPALWR